MTAEDPSADTPDGIRPTVDVLALTDDERSDELARFTYLKGELFHLYGIKASAGIAAGDTHITLGQLKALHRGLGRIVEGLDRPACEGPIMNHLVALTAGSVADLAADAGVDTDALQRHLDGEGPLSQIAFNRVFDKMVGNKATAR